jgi:hypothetical protein
MAAFGFLAERAVVRPILGQPAFSIVDADHRHRLRDAGAW